MNEKDIYSLIGESFDDKIKLNFDDVKNRIAKLEDKESAVITPITPSKSRKKTVFAVVAAAAACLVCVIGLSVVFSGMTNIKSEADTGAYMMYDTANSYEMASDSQTDDSEACYETEIQEDAVEDHAGDMNNTSMGSTGEVLSDTDMSNSDVISESDVN